MNVKKNVVKNVAKDEKVFTKKLKKDIMSKKYNPLNKDKCFYERKGLFMKEGNDVILDELVRELSEKYNKKQQVIRIMFEKCKNLGYNIKESRELIIEFLKCE